MTDWCAERDSAEAMALLTAADAAAGPVMDMADIAADEHFRARERDHRRRRHPDADGDRPAVGDTRRAALARAEPIDADGDDIRAQAGLADRVRRAISAGQTAAAHAGGVDGAVAVGVLVEVLLVVRLGVVERAEVGELGGDRPVAGVAERRRHRRRGWPRLALALAGLGEVDRAAVLRPDVVALAHPLGRVVVLPEQLEQPLVAR